MSTRTPSIILYTDGSSVVATSRSKCCLSWGLVAHHHNQTTERFGLLTNVKQRFDREHEVLALVEGMQYALHQGFSFEQMSFYTDDEPLAYSSFILHEQNYVAKATVERVKNRLHDFCVAHYNRETYENLLSCFQRSRVNVVKGHDKVVYNHRADYLARHARSPWQTKTCAVVPFERWLANNFSGQPGTTTWYAHFIADYGMSKALREAVKTQYQRLPLQHPLRNTRIFPVRHTPQQLLLSGTKQQAFMSKAEAIYHAVVTAFDADPPAEEVKEKIVLVLLDTWVDGLWSMNPMDEQHVKDAQPEYIMHLLQECLDQQKKVLRDYGDVAQSLGVHSLWDVIPVDTVITQVVDTFRRRLNATFPLLRHKTESEVVLKPERFAVVPYDE